MNPVVALRTLALAVALLSAACARPAATLKAPRTGQVARCGGNVSSSLAGGGQGCSRQLEDDERGRRDDESAGFRRVR